MTGVQTCALPISLRYTGGVEEDIPTKDNFVTLITTTYGIKSDAAGSTKLRSAPLNFSYTGWYEHETGKLAYASTGGYAWSRTVYSSTSAYGLYFSSSGVLPEYLTGRGHGRSLRCIAK